MTQTSLATALPGVAVWFTGLSGSGKTTLCRALEPELQARGHRVCVLDSDDLRRTVNRDLGFSKADRDENVARLASLACAQVQQGDIVLVAAISPYRDARTRARILIGSFVEAYVDAPLELCVQRDPKGLYAKALGGTLPQYTGIDDPYEPPLSSDVHLNTGVDSLADCIAKLLDAIRNAVNGTRIDPASRSIEKTLRTPRAMHSLQ